MTYQVAQTPRWRRRPWIIGAGRVLVFVALIGIWEVVCAAGLLNVAYLPLPAQVAGHIGTLLGEAATWGALGETVKAWLIGLGIALGVGVAVGVPLGASRALYRSARLVIDFCRAVPSIALLPLALLIFGSTIRMEVFLIAFAAMWIVLLQTIHGVWDIDPSLSEVMRSYRLTRAQRLWRLVLPSISSYVATGLRLASVVAFFVGIGAELLGGSPGIGLQIQTAEVAGSVPNEYAYAVIAAALALLVNLLLVRLERRLIFWRAAERAEPA
jgi:ABC-type nitrate/sulfonate/bicarbonate transport system permease component